jgi:hypothetical protein
MSKRRPRTGPSPTKIVCEKQSDGTSRCCTFKKDDMDGEPLRCFTSAAKRRAKRGGQAPQE